MDSFFQDFRYALRTLRKSRGFAALAILCIALGIGVNTTIFSIVDGILIRPFPFKVPERLVNLQEVQEKNASEDASPSYLTVLDWKAQTTVFEQIASISGRSLALSDGEEAERIVGGAISWDLFPMLGVDPILGRHFRPEEDQPGGEPVVLLSHAVWRRRYNEDRSIIGRVINVNATPRTIVGVMPEKFQFPEASEAWIPLAPLEARSPRSSRGLYTFARLKPGVTLERARAEFTTVTSRLAAQYPENKGWVGQVTALRDEFVPGDIRLIVLTMMGAVTFVLLIACANVANLLLARASSRSREIAVRAALGAGRGRIVRQLLTESVIIALAGGLIGIPLAHWGLHLMDTAMPPGDVPYYIDWTLDQRVLIYTLLISVATGILFGLAPALEAAKGNLQESLKEGGRGSGTGVKKNRLRSALVVAEVALSLILLIGASLFVRSFITLQTTNAGFDTSPLMTMRMYLPGSAYDSLYARVERMENIVRRVEALPGVESAFASSLVPLGGGGNGDRVIVDGRPVPEGEEPYAEYAGVTPRFFQTLGVRLIAGRSFTEAEGQDTAAVAVINQTMAKRLWAGADPLGRRFRFAFDTTQPSFTVIGVVEDFYNGDLDDGRPRPSAYIPFRHQVYRNMGLVVRTKGPPTSIVPAVRQQLRAEDANIPLFEVATMERVRELGYWQYGLFGKMFSVFGGIALFLAAVGVYGVISYGVSQRTQEIGVRVALGARRNDVLRLVVGQGLKLALIGVGVGLVGAFGITRVIASLLVGVSASDPLSFAAVAVFLSTIAAIASYFPARRAMAVDPIVALRFE